MPSSSRISCNRLFAFVKRYTHGFTTLIVSMNQHSFPRLWGSPQSLKFVEIRLPYLFAIWGFLQPCETALRGSKPVHASDAIFSCGLYWTPVRMSMFLSRERDSHKSPIFTSCHGAQWESAFQTRFCGLPNHRFVAVSKTSEHIHLNIVEDGLSYAHITCGFAWSDQASLVL